MDKPASSDAASVFRAAQVEEWLEQQLGPRLASYASHASRQALESLLARVSVGENVTSHAALQQALAAAAYATTPAEQTAAHTELQRCAPEAFPSPQELADRLAASVSQVLIAIGDATSGVEAEAVANAALRPIDSLMRVLIENELPWPTDQALTQALWDSDREYPAWRLLSHFRK